MLRHLIMVRHLHRCKEFASLQWYTVVQTTVDWDTNEPADGPSENCLVPGYNDKLSSAPRQLQSSFTIGLGTGELGGLSPLNILSGGWSTL